MQDRQEIPANQALTPGLADEINALWEVHCGAACTLMDTAYAMGEVIDRQKTAMGVRLGRPNKSEADFRLFDQWADRFLPYGPRQASTYHRLYRHQDELKRLGARSVTEALTLIKTPREPDPDPIYVEATVIEPEVIEPEVIEPEVVVEPVDEPEVVELHVLGSTSMRDDMEIFDSLMQQITTVMTKAEALTRTKAGAVLARTRQELELDLRSARELLKFAKPYRLCPYCDGSGKKDGIMAGSLSKTNRPSCKACEGRRWVTKDVFDTAPTGGAT